MKPFVSHLIPIYQQESFVEEALLSALEQDYDEMEVIAADDGSTDRTPLLLEGLKSRWGKRLRIVSGPNVGVTRNMNRGLAVARGDLLSQQGGDDVLLPGKMAAQAAWFSRHPAGVLCGHRVEHFIDSSDPAERRTWTDSPPFPEGRGAAIFVAHFPQFAATSVMLRRSAIPVTGFDERLALASDWKLYVDALSGGGLFGSIPGVFARYRHHAGNVTTARATQMAVERFQTLALTEAAYPHLAAACRQGRAHLLYRRARVAWADGDSKVARADFIECLRQDPLGRGRATLYDAIALLPSGVQTALRRVRRWPSG